MTSVVAQIEAQSAIPDHCSEELRLLNPERVSIQHSRERVYVDVNESLGLQRLERGLVDGLQAQRGKLGLVEQAGLRKRFTCTVHGH